MHEAQIYLYKREALLKHLNNGVLYKSDTPLAEIRKFFRPLLSHTYENKALGDPSKRWSILLSGKDLRELDDRRLNLIYVTPGESAKVYRLHDAFENEGNISESVINTLTAWSGEDNSARVRWITDSDNAEPRIYLFIRISDTFDAGWLGVEARSADVKKALEQFQIKKFKLLDKDRKLIIGSSSESVVEKKLWDSDSFSFSNEGPIPSRLELIMHVGNSGWILEYYVEVTDVLYPLLWGGILSLVICFISILFMGKLYKKINLRLIEPAHRRLEALAENESFLRAVIDTSPVALCVIRLADGTASLENRLSHIWLGSSESRKEIYSWVVREFSDRKTDGFEDVGLIEDRHLYLSYMPIRYQGEDVLFCAFNDISARKEFESELAKAKQLADSANEAKTQFLATMSHEIRTPLYGVLGTLELLSRTELSIQQQGYLHAIQRSSSTLQQLISDVLDVAKIEAGKLVLRLSDFSPVELIQDVVHSYAAAIKNKGLNVFVYTDPMLPDKVKGDVNCLRQILNNLLSNSVKYTDSGRIVIRCKLVSRESSTVFISWQVADTGIGISAEEQPRLFNPFYQVENPNRLVGGTGLGLSICMRLVELMKGSLEVTSEVGLGSSFRLGLRFDSLEQSSFEAFLGGRDIWIYSAIREMSKNLRGWVERWGGRPHIVDQTQILPKDGILIEVRYSVDELKTFQDWEGKRVVVCGEADCQIYRVGNQWAAVIYDLSSIREALLLAIGEVSAAMDDGEKEDKPSLGLRVLVAEDSPINQVIVREQLEILGCDVELVSDGIKALQLWQKENFDVVLTDINMPGMDGYALARALRDSGCDLPIIGATANALQDEHQRCLDAGMDLCLVKPVDLENLYQCLSGLIEKTP